MQHVVSIAALGVGGALLLASVLRVYAALDGEIPVIGMPSEPGLTGEVTLAAIGSAEGIQTLVAPSWSPVFGLPAPIPQPTATAAAPAAPRFDYTLAGTMAAGDLKWAILLGPSGEVLVREGETLDGHARIDRISGNGITVFLGDDLHQLVFDGPGRAQRATGPAPENVAPTLPRGNLDAKLAERQAALASRPRVQEVIYKAMSRQELLAALTRAEEERRLRGAAATETR